jgi:oxygen-dependent protoporphyrinogen oxidase
VEHTTENRRKTIAVAGGGITGLSTAYYLKKFLAERGISADIAVVEKSEAMGGKVRTLRRDGFVIERGPDSFLTRKLPIIELSLELGLEGELTPLNPAANKTYILKDGVLRRMPRGLNLGIPTEIRPFLESDLLSPKGKARVLFDFAMPNGSTGEDESLGSFIERRLGKELLENIAEPLLAGIYAGNTYRLSLQATFPQFQAAERKYGSLIRGMMEGRKNPPPPSPLMQKLPEEVRKSVFLSYKQGLTTLIEGLEQSLSESGSGVRHIRDEAVSLSRNGDGTYNIKLKQGGSLHADAAILALPGYTIAELLSEVPEAGWLGEMEYVSVANVVLAYDRSKLNHPLDGTGFLIPRKEKRFITACTWTSSKWLHTAPEGKALIRCYVGRSEEQQWMELDDKEIIRRTRGELQALMGIDAEPMFVELTRLNRSMPQYPLGHLDKIARLREKLAAEWPGVYATGAAFEGVGLPDCIRQAKDTALAAAARLEKQMAGV